MYLHFRIALVAAITLLFAAQVSMGDSAKSPLKGLIKSGSGSGTGTSSALVLSAGADPSTATDSGKVFVLTQACFQVTGASTATVTLTAGSNVVVTFAYANANGGAGCQSFAPGYVVPEGTDVTCAANGASYPFACTVSGIVAKRK
jgi:hypothetical protein